MKVAIIHDWIVSYGGGEKVVLNLHEMFPEAPIYTSVYNKKKMEKYFKGANIKTSFIQKMPFGIQLYKYYLPLMPIAFEQFDLSGYDLVISSSSCCAKGVNVNSNTLHICYCHTPMRYAWDMYNKYNKGNLLKRIIIAKQMNKLRQWDYISSNRVDYFIANSNYVKNRIKKHYRRESIVINPPIDDYFYKKSNQSESFEKSYYLLVSRMVPYKKIDIVVKAFNELNLPLWIIGNGSEKKKIKKLSKENIKFIENVDNTKLKEIYDNSKAFVFMAEEEFGMVMAEAQACGKPVIAYYKGGASEIVKDNETGLLVKEQTVEALKNQILNMEKNYYKFDANKIRENAERFNEINFKNKINEIIKEQKWM